MAFNAGDVEAKLTLDRTPFTTGLATARKQAETFEKKPIKLKVTVDDQTKVPVTAMQKRLTTMTAKPYKVTIGANFGTTNSQLTAFTKKLTALGQRKIKPEINVKTGKSVENVEKVKAALVGLTNKAISINANTAMAYKALYRLDASLTRLTRDREIKVRITTANISKAVNTTLSALKNTTIAIKADTSEFFKKIAEVAKTLNFINNAKVVATIRADSDVAGARTDLLSLELMAQRLSRERINIKVDVDRGMLDRLFGSLTQVGTAQNFAASGASRHTTRLILLAGAISGILGPALAGLAALLLSVPAALAVFGQGIAAVMIGMDGIKQAASVLQPQVDKLKAALVERWEDKLTPIFKQWQGAFPIIQQGLLGQVDALSQWGQAFTDVVTKGQGLEILKQIMGDVNFLITSLTPSVTNMTQAFMTLASVGGANFYSLRDALNSFTAGFNKMVTDAAKTGELATMFRNLGDVVGALLGTLNTLFFVGMKLMVALGPDLTAAIKQLNQTFIDITPALAQLGQGFLEVVTYVAQFISWMAQIGALGPAVAMIVGFTVATKAFALAMKIAQGALVLYRGALLLYTFITGGAAAAQALLNAAMWANPIGVVVAAILIAIGVIAALAYGIYKLIENWDSVMAALKTGWEWLVGLFKSLWDPLVGWFQGIWNSITTAVSDAVGAVGQFFSDLGTKISTGFDNAMKSLAVFFENLPTKIAQWLGQAAGTFVKWIIDLERYLDVAIPKLIENIGNFFKELPGNLLRIGNQAGDWLKQTGIDIVKGLVNGIVQGAKDIYNWAIALPGQISSFLVGVEQWLDTTGWDMLMGMLNGIKNGALAVGKWFVDMPNMIKAGIQNAGKWLWDTGGQILDGLIQGLSNGVNSVVAWFGRIADSFILGFKQAMGIASPSKVFAEIGGFIIEGLLNGVKAAGQAVIDFFSMLGTHLTDSFRGAFEAIQTVATTIWNAVSTFLMTGVNNFVNFWSGVWRTIADFFTSVWQGIQGQATTLWNAISTFLTNGVNAYKQFWAGVWEAIKNVFSTVWEAIKNVATTIWNAIKAYFDTSLQAYKTMWESIWNGIKTFFSTIWEGIKTVATTLWNAIKAFFDTSLEAYKRMWETIWNAIKTFFTTIWEGIKTVGTTIWNAIKSFFDTSLEAYRRMWEMIWNTISTVFRTIWESIRDTGIRLWNAIKSFFETSLDAFQRFWGGLWTGIRDNFGRIFEGIVDIAKRVWQTVKDVFRGGLNAIVGGINWPIDKINGLFGISIPRVPEVGPFKEGGTPADNMHAGGGPVTGRGGPRDDRVPAMLSPREHVLNAQEVIGLGGHAGVKKLRHAAMMKARGLADGGIVDVNRDKMPNIANGSFVVDPKYATYAKNFLGAMNAGQTEALQAAGGRYASYPGNRRSTPNRLLANGGTVEKFAAGGAIQNAVNFARSQTGKPYQWGGGGNPSWDCSGFVGAITRVLRNQSPGRIGATGNFPWPGFAPGLNGSWAVGSTRNAGNGIGHMAGTLAGTNAESGGSKGVHFGGPAIGADNGLFNMRYHLPEVGGAFVSGGAGGGGMFDPAAFFDQLVKTIGLPESGRAFVRQIVPNPPLPNWVEDMGVGMFDKGWAGLRDKAISLISMVSGALGGGTGGDPNVKNAVRQVAVGFGWGGGGQWDAIDKLVQKESSWNPNAANPVSSARGLFQKMTSIHGPIEPTPAGQAQWGLNYIRGRYGTPMNAWAFHQKNNHYDNGNVIPQGVSAVINNTNRNEHAAVFTTDQWRTLSNLSRDEYATAAKNIKGINADDLKNIVGSLQNTGPSGPVVGTIAPQLPAGANVHEVIREIMFYLRHYSYRGRYKR